MISGNESGARTEQIECHDGTCARCEKKAAKIDEKMEETPKCPFCWCFVDCPKPKLIVNVEDVKTETPNAARLIKCQKDPKCKGMWAHQACAEGHLHVNKTKQCLFCRKTDTFQPCHESCMECTRYGNLVAPLLSILDVGQVAKIKQVLLVMKNSMKSLVGGYQLKLSLSYKAFDEPIDIAAVEIFTRMETNPFTGERNMDFKARLDLLTQYLRGVSDLVKERNTGDSPAVVTLEEWIALRCPPSNGTCMIV
jgi:hypothetical protein